MAPLRGRVPALAGDVILAVAVAVFQVRGTLLVTPGQDHIRPLTSSGGTGYVLLVAAGLILIARRRLPTTTFLVTAALSVVYYLAQYPDGPTWVGLFVALYTLTAHGDGRRSLAVAAAATAALTAVWLLSTDLQPLNGAGWVFFRVGAAVGAAALGESVRARIAAVLADHERAARARDEDTRRRVDAERLRMAREVHDTVAHALAVVNIQAGVTAHVLDRRPEQARTALQTIERTSAVALRELRATLGMLRGSSADPDDEGRRPATGAPPTPGLAQLDELAAAVRATGLRVDLDAPHTAAVPSAVEHAAYRIVQEALTNAVRHADPTRVRIRVTAEPDVLDMHVTDDGAGRDGASCEGHGITGMRERAHLLGGELSAGPRPEGGFVVHARLPTRPERTRRP